MTFIHMDHKAGGGDAFQMVGKREDLALMFSKCLLQDEDFCELVLKSIQAVVMTAGQDLKKRGILTSKEVKV